MPGEEIKTGPTIRESGNQELIERVKKHLGEKFLDMTEEVAAQFDTGDLEDSDPRLRATLKILGEETAKGGSGPKKKK
ncbi:hypothetical protein KKE75_03900 [Patescibacteria group bacterium]|nr:hypothetical protein [Patescibacteria group bacterium]